MSTLSELPQEADSHGAGPSIQEPDWRREHKSMAEKLKYIFTSSLFSNVTINVTCGENKKILRAHSDILSLSSPIFEQMFEPGSWKKYTIQVENIIPEIFESMLEFLYSDSLEIKSLEQACELYKLGEKYQMNNLKEKCLTYIAGANEEPLASLRSV